MKVRTPVIDVQVAPLRRKRCGAITAKIKWRHYGGNEMAPIRRKFTIGTLETSILQFTRTMYAKGRDGALHPRYAILHKSWKTPWVATSVIVVIGLLLLFLSSYFPTVNLIIKDSVNAIGFQVACYYSLAGFACMWHFRKTAFKSADRFLFLFLWPMASAAFLTFIAVYSIPTFDLTTNVVGLGGIAIGVVPWAINRRRTIR